MRSLEEGDCLAGMACATSGDFLRVDILASGLCIQQSIPRSAEASAMERDDPVPSDGAWFIYAAYLPNRQAADYSMSACRRYSYANGANSLLCRRAPKQTGQIGFSFRQLERMSDPAVHPVTFPMLITSL